MANKKRPAPSIQPKGPGVWELLAEGGRDPVTGKRIRVSRTFRGNLREAKKARAQLIVDVGTGHHSGTRATIDDLLREWMVELERRNRKPSTLYNYERRYHHDIEPTLGNVEVRKVDVKTLTNPGHDPAVAARHYTGRVDESDRALAAAIEELLDGTDK